MAILKCKMCGGDLNFEKGVTVVDCEYCGTKQTVPTIDDEKKITLFSRANRLRYACEFDKASGVYESIVADFPEEAEAYWGLVLCKYGIEYVDDPATGKKIPTCHRSSFENVMEDENFEQVLENADPIARAVYREEAKQIEELRRGIIEVSNKEEPYDIFICYKETAENGERTIDSVIAQDVYHELTERGYRVFFSRITLEDKLGQEYEPYIFAALNSAKIMLAFGTDYEYYNAVWVKNEWSRFLQLIAKGEKKTLIPCYKNIDAYDMPKEFARLQAQDMGKVGAMQDLLRGIEKLLPKKENEQAAQAQSGKETVIVPQPVQSATVDSLLKRAFMYLEDGDWSNAADYCNHVLDIDPENAEAYVGVLMAELRVRKEEELSYQNVSFGSNRNFVKAIRFSTEERRNVLEGYRNTAEMEISRLIEGKRAYCQQLEKKRRELHTKGSIAVGGWKYSVGEKTVYATFIVARIWDGDSRTAATYVRGYYPWTGSDIVAIAEGDDHMVGLKSDGTVVAVSSKGFSERMSELSVWRGITAIVDSPYGYTIGLKSDKTIVVAGSCPWIRDMSRWIGIVAIIDYMGGVGLKSDGTVVIAAHEDQFRGFRKEVKEAVSDWKNIIAIAGEGDFLVGLKSDGSVSAIRCQGLESEWEPNVADWENVVAIEVKCYLKEHPSAYQKEHPASVYGIVYSREHFIVGLKSDGTVVATGSEYFETMLRRVSDWKDIVTIAVSDWCIVGLKLDGTVVAVGKDKDRKVQNEVADWKDIIVIEVSYSDVVGLKSDGTILVTTGGYLRKDIVEAELNQEQHKRRQSNLCQHCGGEFKGLLSKKCSVCGRPKDY